MRTILYEAKDLNDPKTVRSSILITSAKVTRKGGHEQVSIWSRGGLAGVVIVNAGDGEAIAERLIGEDCVRHVEKED